MIYFFYKCYYVFFLHFSRFKTDVPWFSAITAISGAVSILLLTLIYMSVVVFGFVESVFFTNVEGLAPLEKKRREVLFTFPVMIAIWFMIKYLILNRAKASKKDGRSEIYEFEPTKRDKIVTWVFFIGLSSTMFIGIGILYLLGHYDK